MAPVTAHDWRPKHPGHWLELIRTLAACTAAAVNISVLILVATR